MHNYSEAEIKRRPRATALGPVQLAHVKVSRPHLQRGRLLRIMSMIWEAAQRPRQSWRHVYKVGVCVWGGLPGKGRLTGGTSGGRPAFLDSGRSWNSVSFQ